MTNDSRNFVKVLACVLFALSQPSFAEIYKCTAADGKTSYSEAPCTASGAKESQINIAPAAPADAVSAPSPDWKAINAAANARGQAAMAPKAGASLYASASPLGWGKPQKGSAPAKSNQQIVAECEANHGSQCNSAREINQRRMDQRTLTPQEEKAQKDAVAARRYREQQEQDARYR